MSLRKKLDQIRAQQAQEERLRQHQDAEEKERQRRLKAREHTFFEEHKYQLRDLLYEIDIFHLLKDVIKESWKLGEIIIGGIKVSDELWNWVGYKGADWQRERIEIIKKWIKKLEKD